MSPPFEHPRFELRSRLGSGGMGTVHRALDRLEGREVALKVGRVASGERDPARIGDEFSLLSQLDHAGLVRVLDFGVLAGVAWLTSEIVEGPRLDAWASRQLGAPARIVAVVGELLETLAWLHARGLVHGDIKPANVLVAPAGPVLIDFGLAGSGEALFGATAAYAAPELVAGGAPSAASDLYALGRTLERALLGKSASRLELDEPAGERSLERLAAALTRTNASERPTTAEALAMLGVEGAHGVRGDVGRIGAGGPAEIPWKGAVDRALRALEGASLGLVIERELRGPFLGALGARLMLAGRPAWRLPAGAGLAPFSRIAAALGTEVPLPAETRADDQREVVDAFADRMVSALRAVPPALLPVLLVADADRLGVAGRFVLARLIEARALPAFVVVRGESALERGVEAVLERVEVQASEARGRDWMKEWAALSEPARACARELQALGGAASLEEIGGSPGKARRALAELADAGLTERAEARRSRLRSDFAAALGKVIEIAAPSQDERRRWLKALVAAEDASEAMHRAAATHALALREEGVAQAALTRAALAAEGELAWARAGEHWVARARLDLAAGDFEAALSEAERALKALRAAGGGPLVAQALAIAEAAGAGSPQHRLEVLVMRARSALDKGATDEVIAATSEVLAAAELPWRLRFDALLVRGAALSQSDDKTGAEEDLRAAAALAEEAKDLHALGRTANNLGMLAFHRGDLAGAADAWARAAEAKARSGDRRGERIGRHNRGLALRELGRLAEAEEAANEAAALSEAIGDEVGRATSALAKAQLALDRGALAAAEEALAAFANIGWKPALVAADGQLVRVRLDHLRGDAKAAEAGASAALETAIESRLEPVAAEAWALLTVVTRKASPPPELVKGPLERARSEHGGLAMLLLFVEAFGAAHDGRWSEAKAALEAALARLAEAPLPPAARIGLPLALDAARLAAPGSVAAFEALLGKEAAAVRDDSAGSEVPVDRMAAWAPRLRVLLGATRIELVPLEGDSWIDADDGVSSARFTDLGRRVARRGERFVARGEGGEAQAVALPLGLGDGVIGALVAGFDRAGHPERLLDATPPSEVQVVTLALALDLERRRRERAEAEGKRVAAELRQHLEAHEAEVTALRDALEQSQSALALRFDYRHIVHRSPAMRRVLETLDKVTDRDLPVLVLGESGVGKELLARALHFNGPRQKKRFIAENCGAIPKDLFESQFFGHVKGAFTGALAARQGLFEAADGGTLFLDEIGELPLDMQVKLLRVLQDHKVRPVGSSREVPVDFRLVCATNRDLSQMVAAGRFREDLFYRIAVVKVEVPPLRARKEDIVPIAEHLLAVHGERLGRSVRLTPEAADRLAAYPFPGNVRELENEILRALALSDGGEIRPRQLSAALQGRSEPRKRSSENAAEAALETLEAAFMRVEKELLVRHLTASRGQKVAAARSLGLSRPGLDAKLARHGIDAKELTRSLKEPPR